jgi:transcription elongation factor GreB
MSKAFTREDDLPDSTGTRPLTSPLPPGARNYITRGGELKLRAELNRLVEGRSAAAAQANSDQQLRSLDQRVLYLQQSLQSAVIVDPPAESDGRVRFGTTVTVRERGSGEESRYRIVGVDETDIDRGWVSWLSPIAKALLNARVGDCVRFKFPGRDEELEILAVTYE